MDIEPKSKANQFTRRIGRNEQENGGPTATGIQAGRYRLTRLMGRCLSVPLTGRSTQSLFLQTGGGRARREGGSRQRVAGVARQTGFPDEWETASEWDRGTYTCCFRRTSSLRTPERASASNAASSITTSPRLRKKQQCSRQSDCSPAGSAVRFGRVVCEVCCDMQKTRHRLVPGK